jgi:hypothetical protein
MSKAVIDDYVQRCNDEVEELNYRLETLESGAIHVGQRHAGGSWMDITGMEIAHLRHRISIYKRILDRHETQRGGSPTQEPEAQNLQ